MKGKRRPMNDEIRKFDFKGAALHTLTDGTGEPWFVAKDVCDILELSNVGQALARLDEEEKNSIILNDVYLGDNTYIENCIVESRDTIRANTRHVGESGVKVVVEKNERYAL